MSDHDHAPCRACLDQDALVSVYRSLTAALLRRAGLTSVVVGNADLKAVAHGHVAVTWVNGGIELRLMAPGQFVQTPADAKLS